MEHTTLKNTTKEYWDWSWEELGTHDLPAIIDYILNNTSPSFTTVSYFGHSQGTTQLLAGSSMMPGYFNQKINSAFLMAPPASMTYMTEVFFKIAKIPEMTQIVQWAIESLHMYQQGTWN